MNSRQTMEAPSAEADRIGFFGKVPTHGDFVSIGLTGTLQGALDRWLQAGLAASEQTYGREWKAQFRGMPPWRFVAQQGVWGPATIAGVMTPSTDRVGRSFPLVVAAQLPGFTGNPNDLCHDDTWFIAAEALAETSGTRDFDLTHLTGGLKRLRLPRARMEADKPPRSRHDGQRSMWWTMDPETGQAHGFAIEGQPQPSDFLKLFGAPGSSSTPRQKETPPQKSVAAPVVARPSPPPAPKPAPAPRRTIVEKSYATHAGTRLTLNADSLLIAEGAGLFAIADGVGTEASATEAAKITINTLTGIGPQDTLEALVQELKAKLGRAHSLLQAASLSRARREEQQASVVVLALHRDTFAIAWAGDARCYLLRDGTMRCLTRDHLEVGLRRKLSRSVGAQPHFMAEIATDSLRDSDRLLLCSAPLSSILKERGIAETLISTPVEDVATALVQDALISNARDNISAIVVGIRLE